jgi:hypothetical protein
MPAIRRAPIAAELSPTASVKGNPVAWRTPAVEAHAKTAVVSVNRQDSAPETQTAARDTAAPTVSVAARKTQRVP